ncbi:MAG TPA: CBS domain-containing protein [Verrucomicrobiota bacterium]|nr:CBS domain-containing protein [Verrucomicrobiota bacterium]
MEITGTISSVLSLKPNPGVVWSISPDETVFRAIELLSEKNVGALPVVEGEKIIGMLSERDYTRKVALHGKNSKETLVREIISTNVITVTPQHSVEECLRLMTEHKIRHLPVIEDGKLIGIVSIGDLVNWIIKAQNHIIQQMEDYIHGRYIA